MSLINFPDLIDERFGDIVAIDDRLSAENLLRAYRRGIFPWPIEGWPLTWFCPQERAILDFKDFRIPRSLRKVQRHVQFRFTIDEQFADVIEACASVARAHEEGTWITREMMRAYCELHRQGHAHSVEAWEGTELVGGLYGVDAGGVFAGESMFYLRPNASKLALVHLIRYLQARGHEWIDIQMLTPHMEAFGAKVIPRAQFLERLKNTQGLAEKPSHWLN